MPANLKELCSNVAHTTINYHLPVEEGGTNVTWPGTAWDKLRKWNCTEVEIDDARGSSDDYTLDRNGFQLVQHTSVEKTFQGQEKVKSVVYDEVASLLKQVTGASHVVPFSHIIRRDPGSEAITNAKKAKTDMEIVKEMTPAYFVHIDQSYSGAEEVLRDNIPTADTHRLSKSRYGIINVWRAIEPITRDNLAVCDARTVTEDDLRELNAVLPKKGEGTFDHVSKGASFKVWNVARNQNHRWNYYSKMTPEEVLMIKCFDSKKDGRARFCPHTAFVTDSDSGPARQSIEVRCLVFWEHECKE